jgi:hypothetical protein
LLVGDLELYCCFGRGEEIIKEGSGGRQGATDLMKKRA